MLAKSAGQPHIVGEERLGVELREEAAGADRRGPERVLVVAVLDKVGLLHEQRSASDRIS